LSREAYLGTLSQAGSRLKRRSYKKSPCRVFPGKGFFRY